MHKSPASNYRKTPGCRHARLALLPEEIKSEGRGAAERSGGQAARQSHRPVSLWYGGTPERECGGRQDDPSVVAQAQRHVSRCRGSQERSEERRVGKEGRTRG